MAPPTVLFLFNHDAAHQVAHLAGIVRELATGSRPVRIYCATSTDAIRKRLEAMLDHAIATRIEWLDLRLPAWKERLLSIPNRIAPVKRLAVLDHHAPTLLDCDVLVSAERTCLRLRRRQAALGSRTRFVHVPHGAGDRAVTFHPAKAGFDRILVSGEKTARELVTRGVATPDKLRVIGYAKFDTIDPAVRLQVFDNDRPTFLYNPHFDPFLSSWYTEGPKLLDWFATGEGQRFNLIFAPHIMLFRKTLHISMEYRTARRRPGIAESWREAPNILIDVDSDRLVDMSYALSADAYIGDVSSQIYEFLIRPRPVFFIDRFSQDPRSRESRYPAWSAGDVVSTAQALADLIPSFDQRGPIYRERQGELFADTMSHDPLRSASQRAVEAIMELADQ